MADRKGLRSGRWKVYTVLAWIAGEFMGAVTGVLIFGRENLFSVILVAIAGAITGYFIIKANLSKKPDVVDEIDQIGNNSHI